MPPGVELKILKDLWMVCNLVWLMMSSSRKIRLSCCSMWVTWWVVAAWETCWCTHSFSWETHWGSHYVTCPHSFAFFSRDLFVCLMCDQLFSPLLPEMWQKLRMQVGRYDQQVSLLSLSLQSHSCIMFSTQLWEVEASSWYSCEACWYTRNPLWASMDARRGWCSVGSHSWSIELWRDTLGIAVCVVDHQGHSRDTVLQPHFDRVF